MRHGVISLLPEQGNCEIENCHYRDRRRRRADRLVSAGLAGQARRAVLLRAVERTGNSHSRLRRQPIQSAGAGGVSAAGGIRQRVIFRVPAMADAGRFRRATRAPRPRKNPAADGVHLIGHSLGGTVARRYAAGASKRAVRSLVTLGSPYSYGQWSPRELGIFGDDDPIVPAPIEALMTRVAFGRIVTLHDVGHLALVFHPEALRIIGTELRANRAIERPRVSAGARSATLVACHRERSGRDRAGRRAKLADGPAQGSARFRRRAAAHEDRHRAEMVVRRDCDRRGARVGGQPRIEIPGLTIVPRRDSVRRAARRVAARPRMRSITKSRSPARAICRC